MSTRFSFSGASVRSLVEPTVWCLLVSLWLAGCGPTAPRDFLSEVVPLADDPEIETDHDFCIPLEMPVWKSAADASFMRPDDPVVGIRTAQGPYAIPWWVLKNHHVANLDLDGEEILVTLCEACSSAAAFDPRVDGQRLHFRIVGIHNGTHILRDFETRTLWLSFLGTGKHGPHTGHQLKRRRVDQSSWAEWRELYPETQVAFAEESAREGHGSGQLPGTKPIGPNMKKTLKYLDDRLPRNDLILGVTVNGAERAYPMKALTRQGSVLEDQLGDQPIVVLHKPESFLAAAFSRNLNGTLLDFTQNDRGEIVDQQTGSIWNFAGIAKSGPLQGSELEPVTYIMEEWFIWHTHHPQASLYSP